MDFPSAILPVFKSGKRKRVSIGRGNHLMKRWMISMFLPVLLLSFTLGSGNMKHVKAQSTHYEIYPLPQNVVYGEEEFTITNEVNIVIEEEIDQSTKDFLSEILKAKSIQAKYSEAIVPNKTNLLVGTKNSQGYVDEYTRENLTYKEKIFDEIDAYLLSIDRDFEANGIFTILGTDTDAAYYALATLQMIFEQVPNKTIQTVRYEDYAHTKWRGFIEGFYGFPWSNEDRKSLMRFGGKFKMNSYIFAPKDDPYHNSAWRTLYPEDELAKVKELVDVGDESKTHFIWAIHPGFNMIDWQDYDNELATLLKKLDQLYDIGVRQFGLFLDDMSTAQALIDTEEHVKLVTDVANWVTEKGDVKPLIYTPPFYNEAWTGEVGKPYLQAMKRVPENVEIVWTGKDVIGSVNTEDMQWPKDEIGRDTYIWFNWPVNGYKKNRLLLGKVSLLHPGTHNISGVVSNPLEQAELSKIALFGVADFTWNVDDFDDEKSWLDSFKHIAPEVSEALKTIAYHMSDPSPNGRGVVVDESENIKDKLALFLKQFNQGEFIEKENEDLIAEFDEILTAIDVFREEGQNKAMEEEIEPWLNSLEYVVQSSKHAAKSAMYLQAGNLNLAWENLAMATSAMSNSKKFTRPVINEKDQVVEAGTKRLIPFANELIGKLDAQIHTSIDPDAIVLNPMSTYESNVDLTKMIDGDDSTYAYIQTVQKNGDWYGVDLGKKINVSDISILQGREDDDHDIFHKGILEYSLDGENWNSIGEEQSGYKVQLKDLKIEARYIRYRLTHAGLPGGKPDLWTAIREFAVNENLGKAVLYTNIAEIKEKSVTTEGAKVEIEGEHSMTMQAGEYIGVKLPAIERISEIIIDGKKPDLTVEVSENGVEWTAVKIGETYPTAAYVRLNNKTKEAMPVDLKQFTVMLSKFTEPIITQNFGGVYEGELAHVFDNNPETKLWLNGAQEAGKYIQIDMGGIVDVENVALVINDGEKDYFRQGDLQLSLDGERWETIHRFNNPDNIALNYPEHEAPYRYMRTKIDKQEARYIRLISTENHAKWLALNGIIVNEGLGNPEVENLAITANPPGGTGNEAMQAIDGKLASFYTPKGESSPGYLNYKLSDETKISQFIVLQNPRAITDATVSIRDEQGWHAVGSLSESLSTVDTSKFTHVLEVKIEWDGAVKPEIIEIIPVKKQREMPQVENIADIQALVGQFEESGAFKDQDALRALKTHLTAVAQYEQKNADEKMMKHLKGFELLLKQQVEASLITEEVYQILWKNVVDLINQL